MSVVVVTNSATTTTADPCPCCGGTGCCGKDIIWTAYLGTVTGDGGGEISGCNEVSDTTYPMPWVEDNPFPPFPRIWDSGYIGTGIDCVGAGVSGNLGARLSCVASEGRYTLQWATSDGTVIAAYEFAIADWDCTTCNTFTGVTVIALCCVFPLTVTVCPDGLIPMMLRAPRAMAAPKPPPPAPCKFVGEPLTITDKKDAGLSPRNVWSLCMAGGVPTGAVITPGGVKVACVCKGCNPTCSGYVAGNG